MLKIFLVQCHPRNIFNIKLFLNYGILYIRTYIYTYTIYYNNVPISCKPTTPVRGKVGNAWDNRGFDPVLPSNSPLLGQRFISNLH